MKKSKAKVIARQQIFKGRVVDLAVESIELPGGKTTDLELIRHQGAAAMVPVTDSGEVLLVRQYRHATGGWLVEVPAGKLDPGESPASCAARELEEEVGYRAGSLEELGWIWTTPGFTDERIWLFLCTELEPGRQELQSDEVLTVEAVPLDEAVERALRGDIRDSKSVCALLRAAAALADSE